MSCHTSHNRKLDIPQAQEIYTLVVYEGWSQARVARKFSIHPNRVHWIVHKLNYKVETDQIDRAYELLHPKSS